MQFDAQFYLDLSKRSNGRVRRELVANSGAQFDAHIGARGVAQFERDSIAINSARSNFRLILRELNKKFRKIFWFWLHFHNRNFKFKFSTRPRSRSIFQSADVIFMFFLLDPPKMSCFSKI